MDVAIFGAGIAGLMTAITLRAQGHNCHVYAMLSSGAVVTADLFIAADGTHSRALRFVSRLANMPGLSHRNRGYGSITWEAPCTMSLL